MSKLSTNRLTSINFLLSNNYALNDKLIKSRLVLIKTNEWKIK